MSEKKRGKEGKVRVAQSLNTFISLSVSFFVSNSFCCSPLSRFLIGSALFVSSASNDDDDDYYSNFERV